MNTQELIELTTLASLGLLDADEQIAYETALCEAPPALRARVLDEARRVADLGDLLPDEQPSPELRELVIAAVRAAMREQEVERRLSAAPAMTPAAVAGRIEPRRTSQPAMPRSARVHAVWRAAAIGLAAATVALSVVSFNIRGTYRQLDSELLISELYDRMGAEFVESTLLDPNTRRISLVSAQPGVNAAAAVWHNPDWSSARLFVKNLKPNADAKPYRLVVLDENGQVVRELAEFNPTGELEDFSVTINPETDRRLAIMGEVQQSAAILRASDSSL